MAGINRAERIKAFTESRKLIKKPCIFISHISIDKQTAISIGDYIMKKGDLDIYLDIYDDELQKAAANGDPFKVTESIEKGLNDSSHIMCLVSENTIKSWWVPYELGYAKNAKREISTLTLKNTVTLPDYLKIGTILRGTKSLNAYLENISNLSKVSSLMESAYSELISHAAQLHPLDIYLDWQN